MWVSWSASQPLVATALFLSFTRHPTRAPSFPVVTRSATRFRNCCCSQANLIKQLSKLVKVRYVEDITSTNRIGEGLTGGQGGRGGTGKTQGRDRAGQGRARPGDGSRCKTTERLIGAAAGAVTGRASCRAAAWNSLSAGGVAGARKGSICTSGTAASWLPQRFVACRPAAVVARCGLPRLDAASAGGLPCQQEGE